MFETMPTIVSAANAPRRPTIVIVGSGFGALAVKIPPAPLLRDIVIDAGDRSGPQTDGAASHTSERSRSYCGPAQR
jgi:hypothetical protein